MVENVGNQEAVGRFFLPGESSAKRVACQMGQSCAVFSQIQMVEIRHYCLDFTQSAP